jgi:hypothetical protein
MRNRKVAIGLVLAALASASACGERSPSRQAARILDRYRKTSGAKPLPASGMIRVRLSAPDGRPAATGRAEILWEPGRYRESVSSAGMTTVRGIESGKAYFTDQDGVTRVASDQVLRELVTRSYFWRRGWLFADRERAWPEPGPADAASVSIALRPEGGTALRLVFSKAEGRLLEARAPRFALEFASPASFRDVSDPAAPFLGEVEWTGLPTGPIARPSVGGEKARFAPSPGAAIERRAGALLVAATLSSQPIRLAVDGAADGPVAVSPAVAARTGLAFAPDVFGRRVASGASLELAGAAYPSLWIEEADALPAGADARAGGCLFREAVVEIDPAAGMLRLHDAAGFPVPEGYVRIPIDDDDDRPVAILNRGKKELRLTLASDTGDAALVVATASAARLDIAGSPASGLAWGPVRLPPLPVAIRDGAFTPEWGADGLLGFPLLLRFHAWVDMPQRWIYVKPAGP